MIGSLAPLASTVTIEMPGVCVKFTDKFGRRIELDEPSRSEINSWYPGIANETNLITSTLASPDMITIDREGSRCWHFYKKPPVDHPHHSDYFKVSVVEVQGRGILRPTRFDVVDIQFVNVWPVGKEIQKWPIPTQGYRI